MLSVLEGFNENRLERRHHLTLLLFSLLAIQQCLFNGQRCFRVGDVLARHGGHGRGKTTSARFLLVTCAATGTITANLVDVVVIVVVVAAVEDGDDASQLLLAAAELTAPLHKGRCTRAHWLLLLLLLLLGLRLRLRLCSPSVV